MFDLLTVFILSLSSVSKIAKQMQNVMTSRVDVTLTVRRFLCNCRRRCNNSCSSCWPRRSRSSDSSSSSSRSRRRCCCWTCSTTTSYPPVITQHSHTNGYARRDINIHTIQSAQSLIARKQILYIQ